jgi:hypothetical protein
MGPASHPVARISTKQLFSALIPTLPSSHFTDTGDPMPDPRVEKLLGDYLEREATDRASGYTPSALHKALKDLVDRFNTYVSEDEKRWVENKALHQSHNARLVALEASERAVHAATVGKPNSEGDSETTITGVHDLKAFAEKIAEAARGASEDEVAALVDEKTKELEERRELKRLQAIESQVNDDKLAKKKAWTLTVIGAVGGAGAILLAGLIVWALSLHH